MIPYYFLYAILGIVGLITSPITNFADATLPDGITASLATIGYWFHIVQSTIPYTLPALFVALGILVGVETKIFSYKTIKWVYTKIPGIN